MSLGNADPPATNYEVDYLFHGQPARAIFLTKDKAEDYVVKYHLDSAKIMRCWNEEVVNNVVNKRVEQRMQDLLAMQKELP
jgi:hypothetical protein